MNPQGRDAFPSQTARARRVRLRVVSTGVSYIIFCSGGLFLATAPQGITAYLEAGGTLENAQAMAAPLETRPYVAR